MDRKIQRCLNHLNNLRNEIFELNDLAFWLFEYDNLYKEVKKYSETKCIECQEFESLGLPYSCLQNPPYCTNRYDDFIEFFEKIDKCLKYHQYEEYSKIALFNYEEARCDDNILQWMIDNFDVGFSKLCLFCALYVDDKPDNTNVLHIANSPNNQFGVLVATKCFQNIIELSQLYRVLFLESKLYPTKLKQYEEEMNKIVFPMLPIPKIR
ncbi:hypothetical protein PG279_07475 [Riemerella anatipestifer]|nr:hypothetical protein [Riemerella anatipestifer]